MQLLGTAKIKRVNIQDTEIGTSFELTLKMNSDTMFFTLYLKENDLVKIEEAIQKHFASKEGTTCVFMT